jgi:hypothetical protein
MSTYAQQLSNLLPLTIRSAGDPAGPTTAEDHRAFESLEIEAISYLESMARGNRIFSDELYGVEPPALNDVLEGDLFLDRSGNLALWSWIDGEWVALGDLVGAAGAKILGGAGVPSSTVGTIGDWYFRYNVAAYEKTPGGWVNRFALGSGGTALPDPTGQGGKFLGTDGTNYLLAEVPAGYSDNQAKDAALQSIATTSTILPTYNLGTHTLTIVVRTGSLTVAHLDPTAILDIDNVPSGVKSAVASGTYSSVTATYAELQGALPSGSVNGMRFKRGQAIYWCMFNDAGVLTWMKSPVAP